MPRGFIKELTGSLACVLVLGLGVTGLNAAPAQADSSPQLDLRVLLIGLSNNDPVTQAWENELTAEGVPYTLTLPQGSSLSLPQLTNPDDPNEGLYDGVVLIPSTYQFSWGTLGPLWSYESEFGVRQIDGYVYPAPALQGIGYDPLASTDLSQTTPTLTAAGLSAFPALAGPVPLDASTYGYPSTVQASNGDVVTPLLDDSDGDTLIAVDQHPTPDDVTGQSGVSEMAITFDYGPDYNSWLVLAPSLIDWLTGDVHLGLVRNYIEMDIDDVFTPDNAWDITNHTNDYSLGDSLRMGAADAVYAAQWSKANNFRLDMLFNGGGSVAYQEGDLDLGPGGPDPLLAQFQTTDPQTGEPYADDFGWISHTYDTPLLDVGCATQDYIEAELNENSNWAAAAPGSTLGTGGLGLTESSDDSLSYGSEDPQVFVPGNHSGLADLVPGNPATVDPPALDNETVSQSGGTFTAGSYQYAVTDQFNGSDSPDVDQSQAYVTGPLTVPDGGSVSLNWQAICHASNYLVYREVAGSGDWSLVGSLATPSSATLPDNSSGNSVSTTDVSGGGELELTYVDSGTAGTPQPTGWTPPTAEDANELPWEQNPYFVPALQAVGITTVGADASKPYPDPPDNQFGIGAAYSGPEYPAGTPFVDGTSEVVPRKPVNVYYNASTEAQEVDEYNTLYLPPSLGGTCEPSAETTCETAPASFAQIVSSVTNGMFTNMLSNDPAPTYVHQTNIMGEPPPGPPTSGTPPNTPDTTGDGLLYSVLNPLLDQYHQYFSSLEPYVQLTFGQIGTVASEQSAWSNALAQGTVDASEQNGAVTITNSGGSAIKVPVSMPVGSSENNVSIGGQYGATSSGWVTVQPGASVTVDTVGSAPAFTSGTSATGQTGSPMAFTVQTSGTPYAALSESGALPDGVTFSDNGNGTATLAGTPEAGTGGVYPLVLTANNGVGGPVNQDFTLTIGQTPAFTSGTAGSAEVESLFTVSVTTSGFPEPALSESGALPDGVTFSDNGNGTATLAGTPVAGTAGIYPLVLTANNGVGGPVNQDFTLTVSSQPSFIGADSTTFSVGQSGTFMVTTSGLSQPALSESGALPDGVTFTDNGNGTATLAGTPEAGTGGVYPLVLAAEGAGSEPIFEDFVLTVDETAAVTSQPEATFKVGDQSTFTVEASGTPDPALSESGTLPPGVTFTDNGNGSATLAGTPQAGTGGAYNIVLTANNGIGSPAIQDFILTVDQSPAFTSSEDATFVKGQAGSFTVSASGYPSPTLIEAGTLPTGLSFEIEGEGAAIIMGTPRKSGTFDIRFSATSTVGTVTQTLAITVATTPTISAKSLNPVKVGGQVHLVVSAKGYPLPIISESGALPTGVTFTDNGSGTAVLSGTPAEGSEGTYPLTFTASNSGGQTSTVRVLRVES
ncbi:MAG TPA: putative Ig domain-containing protein [Acidimicrobiales bacterium]|nr:putative Ig domain-containing protein [Acidimicrobiales bacterium]